MANSTEAQSNLIQNEEDLDLINFLSVIYDSRWLIAIVVCVVTALSVMYAFLAKPIYEANVIVQVEDSDFSAKNLLGDLSPLLDAKSATTAEIELIRSRLVLTNAVSSLRLFIVATPKYFPIFGSWLAGHNEGALMEAPKGTIANPFLGLDSFAWGGESIDTSEFNVPSTYWEKEFTVVKRGGDKYELFAPNGDLVLKGTVGQQAVGSVDDGRVSLTLKSLHARASTKFTLIRNSELDTVEKLQDNLKIEEQGKQSGILSVTLQGPSPLLTQATLNALSAEYVKQNLDLKSADAAKTITFLEKQLPELKKELDEAEEKYNQFRNKSGTINLSEEAKLILQQSVDSKAALLDMEQKRLELAQRFTPSHPSVVALDSQIASAKEQVNALSSRIATLPNVEQSALRLMRDVAVDTDLYTGLLNNTQQLRVLKAGKVGNVRVVDYAQLSEKPVKPKKTIAIALGIVLGFVFGISAAFVRKSLRGGVESGDAIERATGLAVYAAIPHSEQQRRLNTAIGRHEGGLQILAAQCPDDVTVESLRSLRTSLQFAMLDAPNNIVVVTGPSPGVGKSFVSSNLATVLATSGQKVLLIDLDLRRGHVHDFFGVDRVGGITELISGTKTLDNVVHSEILPNLDFISTGATPPHPSELLLNRRFAEKLTELSDRYDIVILDTPPILAVTDAAIVGKYAGTTLLALRHGKHPMGEIVESVRRLRQAGVSLKGVLLNDLPRRSLGYGGQYAGYYSYTHSREVV